MEYVYVLKSNKRNEIKIGRTQNYKNRLKQFYIASKHLGIIDEEFNFLKIYEVEDSAKLESLLHKTFSEKRVIGEWFSLTLLDIEDFMKGVDLSIFKKEKINNITPTVPLIYHSKDNIYLNKRILYFDSCNFFDNTFSNHLSNNKIKLIEIIDNFININNVKLIKINDEDFIESKSFFCTMVAMRKYYSISNYMLNIWKETISKLFSFLYLTQKIETEKLVQYILIYDDFEILRYLPNELAETVVDIVVFCWTKKQQIDWFNFDFPIKVKTLNDFIIFVESSKKNIELQKVLNYYKVN